MAFDPVSLAFLVGQSLLTQTLNARAARVKNLSQFSGLPTNDETRAVPEIVGEVEMEAPHLLDQDDFKYSSVRTEFPMWLNILVPVTAILDQVPWGYRYYMGLDFGLCKGPDVVLTGIKVGDKLVWEGSSTGGSITIKAPGAFGHDGGVYCVCDFYPGSDTQGSNTYWKSRRTRYPAYRDWAHLAVRGPSSGEPALGKIKYSGYVGRSPQLKPWKFRLRRIPDGLGQSEYATIDGRLANPVEYMYEKFTSETTGLGLPPAMFDLAAWRAAAQTVYEEGIGISFKWDTPAPHGDVIELMRQTVDCVFYTSLAGANAGKITIRLIRDDYDVEDLPVVTVTNAAEVSRYVTRVPDGIPNDIRLDYTDVAAGFVKAAALFQSLANRHLSEALEPLQLNYPVGSAFAAQQLVTREAVARVVPLKEVDLRTNFELYDIQPGDPFVFNWPEYGVEQLVLRAVKPKIGSVDSLDVGLECVEDRFKTGESAFGVVTTRTDTLAVPSAAQDQLFFEVHSTTTAAPPGAPVSGDAYVIAAGATGAWAGHDGALAHWDGSAWVYQEGDDLQNRLVYDIETGQYHYNDGGTWAALDTGAYTTVQEEGVSLTQRAKLNFIGPAVTAADDAVNGRTNVTITSGLTVEESDGAPTEAPVSKIIVPKNWQTEPAAGQVRFKPRHLLVFEFDGFGSVLTTSVDEAQIEALPWDCQLLSWRLMEASTTPIASTATVDVRKDSYANYPPTSGDSMTGTGTKPNLAGPQTKNEGSNFTDWTTTQFAAGDVPRAVLTAVTLAKKLRLVLTVEEL